MKYATLNWAAPAFQLTLLLVAVTVVSAANGQQTPMQSQKPRHTADPATVQRAITKVQKGDFSPIDLAIIIRSHAVQAIPALEIQFARSKDPQTKTWIADALVRLGKKNGPYWDFMVDRARKVLQDVPPTPFTYDASGKAVSVKPTKRLIEWAGKHHISADQAWQDAIFWAPGVISDLGYYDDDRAIPVLREALDSENDMVKLAAAQGLAELHDTASIPAVILACENAPKEEASAIAQFLVYFNDPAAQRAVDEYVPKSTAQELRKAVAHGKTPYH
jgi:hypothetical protein